jgi:predicted dehydrogenase
MQAFGIGIIGFGFMGRAHSYGLLNIPLFYHPVPFRVKHISVCRRSAEGRAAAGDMGYYRRVVADYRELIDDPEIDVICVATPNRFHKEHLIAAIRAGKHIYCDKPAVTSEEEADEVLAVMRETGYAGKTQMVFHNRFLPAVLRAKQLIDEGFLGRVYQYRGAYLHASNADPNRPLAWKSTQALGGGGSLVDLGSHLIDMMQFLLGDIASIYAVCETLVKERTDPATGRRTPVDTDDLALMIARHHGGALGALEATKLATGICDELRFEIHGEGGALRFNLMEANWLDVYDQRDPGGAFGGARGFKRIECLQQYPQPATGFPAPKVNIGWLRAHLHCMHSFLEAIALDRAPSPSLEDGLRLQRVLAAAYRSAASGRDIAIG